MPSIKEFNRARFLELKRKLLHWRDYGLPEKDKKEFILVSLEFHALKGEVPKTWWRMPRKGNY